MKSFHLVLLASASLSLFATTAADARPGAGASRPSGGSSATFSGPRGGSATHQQRVTVKPDGSVSGQSSDVFQTPAGSGSRSSATNVAPDGSGSRSSQFNASGQRGSVDSSSNVARDAAGNRSGGRQTSATSASTGNGYEGSTQIDPATGKPVHNGSCTDASGAVIACSTPR